MNQEELVKSYEDMFAKIGRTVARDYPNMEWEYISQELMIVVLTKPDDVPAAEDSKAFPFFFKAAKMIANKQRTAHLTITPQYHYRQSDVRKILESSFYYSEWQNGYVPEDDYSEYKHADGIIARADVTWAIELLSPDMQEVIFSRYRDGVIPQQATPEYRKLDRTLRRLTDIINSYKRPRPEDGPGTRRVFSNAQARAITESDSDGSMDFRG